MLTTITWIIVGIYIQFCSVVSESTSHISTEATSFSPAKPLPYKIGIQKFSNGPIISNNLNNSDYTFIANPSLFLYDDKIWLYASVTVSGEVNAFLNIAQINIDSKNGSFLVLQGFGEGYPYFTGYPQMSYPSVSQYNDTYYRFINTPPAQVCRDTLISTQPTTLKTTWNNIPNNLCSNIDYLYCMGLFANEKENNLSQDYLFCTDMLELNLSLNTSIRILSGNRENFTWGSDNDNGFDEILISPTSDILAAQPGPAPILLLDGNFLYLYNAIMQFIDFGFSFTSRLAYAILDGYDPSKILQQSNLPFPNSNLGQNGYLNGLIPDPNKCKFVEVSTILSPEYQNTVECFFGVYSGDEADLRSIYGLYVVVGILSEESPSSTPDGTINSKPPSKTTSVTSSKTFQFLTITSTIVHRKQTPLKFWYFLVGVALIVIIGSILLIFFIKRRRAKREKTLLKFISINPSSLKATNLINEFRQKYGQEINHSTIHINFIDTIGKGVTSAVYKGYIKTNAETKNIVLKILTENSLEIIENELNILTSLPSHPNIVKFFGWCLINDTPGIVTELAISDLHTYISSIKLEQLATKIANKILYQISNALEHLAGYGIIHRDVACRNILLFDNFVVKLSDFGLSCDFNDANLISEPTLRKRFPIKWLSPEAMISQEFSEKSDVWAFGILCYEIFSYDEIPYSNLTATEQREFLESGQRLSKPDGTPEIFYQLMIDSWHADPEERPTFTVISKRLKIMLEYESVGYGYLQCINS